MINKSRTRLTAAGFLLLSILLCGLVIRLADTSLTAAGAKRLPCADAEYVWVNSNHIITFSITEAIYKKKVGRGYSDDVVKAMMDAERTDIKSGSRNSLIEFDKLFPAETPGEFQRWSVSPNGSRLLFSDKTSDQDYYHPGAPQTVWTFDMGPAIRVDPDVYAGISYSCDYALWTPNNGLLVLESHDGVLKTALYNMEARDDSTVAVAMEGSARTPIGITPDGRLVSSDFAADHATGITIVEQGVWKSQAPLRKHIPAFPAGAVVKEIALSPNGNRLAWTVSRTYVSPAYRYIKKLAPKLAVKFAPKPVVSLYVSSLDCKVMRLIGMEENPPNVPGEQVRSVRWRPDGKSISYRWRHGIYMAPVD